MHDRFATLRAPSPLLLFSAMFLASFVIQWATWARSYPYDDNFWIDASRMMARGELIGPGHFIYGYPGTTVIAPTAGLILAGFEGLDALKFTMAVIFSVAAAGIVLLAYLLRPALAWWPLAAWALLLQHNVYFATPPSSILGPVLALFTLLILYALERKNYSLPLLALIGLLAGIAAATRIDIGGLITGTGVLAFALFARSARVFILTSLIGLVAFYAMNPFLWHDALGFFTATFEKIAAHAAPEHNSGGALKAMFTGSLFGAFSFFFLAAALVLKLQIGVRKGFLLWLFCGWGIIFVSLFISAHHPAWIFYPALVPLELLFPLFLIPLIGSAARRLSINPAILSAFLLGAYLTYYLVRYQLFTH